MGRGQSIEVGDVVPLRLSGDRVAARVIEDRGPLGPNGERVLRVSFEAADELGGAVELELPASVFDQVVDVPAEGGPLTEMERRVAGVLHMEGLAAQDRDVQGIATRAGLQRAVVQRTLRQLQGLEPPVVRSQRDPTGRELWSLVEPTID